ncbi:hypothetical protein DL771_003149 [Monosporascus sp. 5C6A]|nr:hypothetical protein DL771_003149 [Monosporascus sp. 5C6A]
MDDRLLDTVVHELDAQSNKIVQLIMKLIEILNIDIFVLLKDEISAKWECTYKCRDLSEQVWRLKKQLRESIPLTDWIDPPAKIESALEAAHDGQIKESKDRIKELELRIEGLELQLRSLRARLMRTLTQNWELRYKCRDLSEDVWRLKAQLRRSVALSRSREALPWKKPKTALERALEKRIEELEGRGKHPRRKARSRSI